VQKRPAGDHRADVFVRVDIEADILDLLGLAGEARHELVEGEFGDAEFVVQELPAVFGYDQMDMVPAFEELFDNACGVLSA